MAFKPFMKEGYWANDAQKAFVALYNQTGEGGNIRYLNLIGLDYPDIPSQFVMNVEFGDFGPARKEVQEASGIQNYNFQLSAEMMGEMKMPGVVSETGDRYTLWGYSNKLEQSWWLNDVELQKIKDDRDPVETPSCPHITPRPGSPGKIYWLSGPPGAGKSTTCQLMARKKDFRYFEADCTMQLVNPFTDIHVDNPSVASFSSKSLKGVSEEDAKTVLKFGAEMGKFMTGEITGNDFDILIRPVLNIMGKDIARQKVRLGGDFAVAQAVVTRESRELLRQLLGPDLVFIVLNLTKECQHQRIDGRHPGKEQEMFRDILYKMFDAFEPAGEDEHNAYNVSINENMSKDEVMDAVLKTIETSRSFPSGITIHKKQQKLTEGYWNFGDSKNTMCIVKSNVMTVKNIMCLDYPDLPHTMKFDLEYGVFDDAKTEVKEASGKTKNNVYLKSAMMNMQALLNDEGTKMWIWGWANKMEIWEHISQERLEAMREDRDDYLAPSCPHITPKPGTSGKIIWLSGPPGAGKSTTCQLMARSNDYIYYEADCVFEMVNPFTDLHVDNPTMASMTARPLKGMPKDEAEALIKASLAFEECAANGMKGFDDIAQPMYTAMIKDIRRQKKRLGGNFAVAHAVATRTTRNRIRQELGNDVVFIILNMTKKCQSQRMRGRHGDNLDGVLELMEQMHKLYEPAGKDEPNAYDVTIDEDDSKETVLQRVLDLIRNKIEA